MTDNIIIHDLAERLYRRDLLLIFLRQRLKLSPGAAYFIIALVGLVALLFLPVAVYGMGFPETEDTLVSLLQSLFIMPLGGLLYVQLPGILAGTFNRLAEGGVIGQPLKSTEKLENVYTQLIERFAAACNRRLLLASGLLISLAYAAYRLFFVVPGDVSLEVPAPFRLANRLCLLVLYCPLIYAAVVTGGRLLWGMIFTRRLMMDFEIRISPLHPDGVGGLGAIGQLLTGSALIATIFGAVSAGMIIASQATNRAPFQRAETIALLILYTLLLPLLFAFWLWAPHQAQLRARGKALQPLTDEYQRALAETLPTPEAGAEALEKRTKRLEAIQAQYKLIKLSFPVWPLPAEQLTRLTAITSLPAISPFLTGLVGSILKFIVSQFGAPSP